MKRNFKLVLAAMVMAAASQVSAHHSTANYDYSKTIELTGTLRKLQWTNPHCFLQVAVPNGKGGFTEWAIEAGSPGLARRLGWQPEMFKAGDKVKVVMAPLRSGEFGGTLRTVTLANGKVLYGPGNQGAAPTDLGLPTLGKAK